MDNKKLVEYTSVQIWLVIAVFVAGFLIRLVDLTDPPIDFHPTRQYRGAIIARSIYIDNLPADHPDYGAIGGGMVDQFADLEPLILENMMAFIYRLLGGEQIWLVRIVNAVFWGIGGLALWQMLHRVIGYSPTVVTLLYYFFLPFGVYASRSFQPDPLMTVGMIFTVWLTTIFLKKPTWQNVIILAFVAGFTVFVKVVSAYLIGAIMVAMVFHRGFKKSLADMKIWVLGIVMILIPASYYLISADGKVAGNASGWIVQMLPLLLKPTFWIGWVKRLYAFGPVSLVIGAIGLLLVLRKKSDRQNEDFIIIGKLLIAAFIGYGLFAISFPYHIPTHSYYHIQLIPVMAWAIGFGVFVIIAWVKKNQPQLHKVWWGIIGVWLIFVMGKTIGTLTSQDFRHEPPYWQSIGEVVPNDGGTVGLVSYYGFLLKYYGGEVVRVWPDAVELGVTELRDGGTSNFEQLFNSMTEDKEYFLVTAINQLDDQPNLSDYLYDNFPIVDQGPGYILFSLENENKGGGK